MQEKYLSFFLISLMVSPLAIAGETEDDRDKLKHNPFENPYRNESGTVRIDSAESMAQSSSFELRATLISGSESLANINGVMVPVGADINGYRLANVSEGAITLIKGDTELTITLDKERGESGLR